MKGFVCRYAQGSGPASAWIDDLIAPRCGKRLLLEPVAVLQNWPFCQDRLGTHIANVEGNGVVFRTPDYNASCPDFHWLVAHQAPLTDKEANETDNVFRNRWRALMSVDDGTLLISLLRGIPDKICQPNP